MSYTSKTRPIAVISSSATKDLELAGIGKKERNGMKRLEKKKYINAGFVATACRFTLSEPLERIISNYISRKSTKSKKTMTMFLLSEYVNLLR